MGTNLRFTDGGNFVKPSDNSNSNWGNIAGITFDGVNQNNSSGDSPAIRFLVDQPGENGANYSLGSGTSGKTAAIENKTAAFINGNGHFNLKNITNSHQELRWVYGSSSTVAASIGWGNGSANWEFKHFRADAQAGAPYANIDFFTGSTSSPTRALRITEDGMLLIGETNDDGMTSYDLGMKNGRAIRFRNSAGNGWINAFGSDGSNNITIGSAGSPVLVSGQMTLNYNDTSSNYTQMYVTGGGDHAGIVINPSANKQAHLRFYTNGSAKWQWRVPFHQNGGDANAEMMLYNWANSVDVLKIEPDGTQHARHFYPQSNDTYDLGATGTRWRNLYVNDLQLSNESKKDTGGNDVDGTWGDWTLQEGEDKIYMINNRTGKKYSLKMEEE